MQAVLVAGKDPLSRGSKTPLCDVVVGGITLLQRAVRSAQRAGAERILVLSASEAQRDAICSDVQLKGAEVEWYPHDEALSTSSRVIEAASQRLDERFWLTTIDRVVSPQMFPPSTSAGDVQAEDTEGTSAGVYLVRRDALLSAVQEAASIAEGAQHIAWTAHRPQKPVWHPISRA